MNALTDREREIAQEDWAERLADAPPPTPAMRADMKILLQPGVERVAAERARTKRREK